MHVSRLFSRLLVFVGAMVFAMPAFAQAVASDATQAVLNDNASDDLSDEPMQPTMNGSLPRPAELEPQINFWRRVYSEVDSHHGFIHDSRHMNVVYATIEEPHSGSRRANKRALKDQKQLYVNILTTLAQGKRTGLTEQEANVLGMWPSDVTNAQLREASYNVRYQTGQRDRFLAGVMRSRRWMPNIVSTFAAAGLPVELAALPHVESSFDMRAYSSARAAGIFQFTKATGKQYMHISSAVDERYDPLLATGAAARLLANNYRRINDWPLAITAYNHGIDGMVRATKRMHTTDLATLVKDYHTRHFGFASRNFYTELLAAYDVSTHAEKYFGVLPGSDITLYASAKTDAFYHAGSLAKVLGVDLAILRANNPALTPAVWSGKQLVPAGFTLRLPQPQSVAVADLSARMAAIPDSERFDGASGIRIASLHPVRSTPAVQTASFSQPSSPVAVPGTWRADGYTPVPAAESK
jgi:membrane-bound lytic murein transglycosylase D